MMKCIDEGYKEKAEGPKRVACVALLYRRDIDKMVSVAKMADRRDNISKSNES